MSGYDDAHQPFVAGVYPMLLDETCFFLAADFDKTGWREDACAFAETCRRLDLPAAIERSRSGQGGHVWLYADLNVPMLARMFDRRCRGYEAVGYTIVLPASAVPGWPAVVPLPSDLGWKQDYASSIRRLIRDGVDAPLANLFVHAARRVTPEAIGVDRARSATEAFLYRRLETLDATRARFALNANLPIPFDGRGQMEVDLLCANARVVVELDGAQHLADAAAYRRDRHKDLLLQENGYRVLRFLAEDVGKELDSVMDTILRSLTHVQRVP